MTTANRNRILLAFASLYVFWGSTYLAIRVAGERLPVPVVSAARCWISAVLIAGITLLRGRSLRVPQGEVWKLALTGVLYMSGNNMLLTWGETMVPSGFASLVISMTPVMVALIEMLRPGGEALNLRGWAGTLLGAAGIAVLVGPAVAGHVSAAEYRRPVLGTVVLFVAAFCFSLGTVLARRFRFKADPFVATGWQIGSAAVVNSLVAVGLGVVTKGDWSWRGASAIVYLAIAGTLFGLFALTYLLQHVEVTKVSTYAFVNPVIAVLLGVLLLGERLDRTQVLGMGVIVCGVAMVVLSRRGAKVVTTEMPE